MTIIKFITPSESPENKRYIFFCQPKYILRTTYFVLSCKESIIKNKKKNNDNDNVATKITMTNVGI